MQFRGLQWGLVFKAALPLFCLSAACADLDPGEEASSQSQAVIGGLADTGFPATALIEIFVPKDIGATPDDEPAVCSGVWFANNAEDKALILTAGNCVLANYEAEEGIGEAREPGLSGLSVHFGLGASGDGFDVESIVFHRYYEPEEGRSADNLAILTLGGKPATGRPAELESAPAVLEEGVTMVSLVGYGLQDESNPTSWGGKRSVTVPVNSFDGTSITAGNSEETTCRGDTGGPVYQMIDGVQKVIAINSQHSRTACPLTVRRMRIDRYYEEFIGAYLDCTINSNPECDVCDYDGVCEEDCPSRDWDCEIGQFSGEVCEESGECEQNGACIPAGDDPSFTYCAKTCDPDLNNSDCPSGMVCLDDDAGVSRCEFDPDMPSPGSQGSACNELSAATDCRSGLCEDRICVSECDLLNPDACAEPFVCGPSKSDSSRNVCLGTDLSGGGGFCNVGSGSSHSPLGGLFFVILMAAYAASLRLFRKKA